MVNKIVHLWLLLFLGLGCIPAFAQEDARARAIEEKKNDSSIRWGEGESTDEERAKELAEQDLLRKFQGAVGLCTSLDQSNDANGNGREDYTNSSTRLVFAIIDNPQEIKYKSTRKNKETKKEETWYHVFCYITEKEYQRIQEDRHEQERELIKSGIEQEQNVCIAGALKYYNWAHSVIKAFNDDRLTMEISGQDQNCLRWLERKVESVLSNLKFEIDETSVVEQSDADDKYDIVINTTYAGNPVSSLDVSYFNNITDQEVRAHDGKMTLSFPNLPETKDLTFSVRYRYSQEANNERGIVKSAYEAMTSSQRLNMDNLADRKLPFKFNTRKGTAKASVSTIAATPGSTMTPDIKTPKQALDRSEIAAPKNQQTVQSYIESMMAVENALRKKKYEAVRDLFTPEGYHIFQMLTSKSKISVVGKPEYSVEETDLFARGTSIPIKVSRANHNTTENLVFRFDKQSGKISSVAFALTKRAEDDIFRAGAEWAVDSRYSILTFMEDYQTAFHTQDTEYIKKIFSNDAIIITGKFTDNINAEFNDDVLTGRGARKGKHVVYATQNKEQYIENLQKCFDRNSWTHIDFEHTAMEKVDTKGVVKNDVMWIELKQVWTSSNYCDVGYLALQINLVPKGGSKINVRTWTQNFVEIDELKNRFKIE